MKLAFIAMSGVRAHDPELTRLGLTLPGFVERSKKIASLPSLGLLTLAGATPAGVEVEYIEVEDVVDVDELPGEFDLGIREPEEVHRDDGQDPARDLDPVGGLSGDWSDLGFFLYTR